MRYLMPLILRETYYAAVEREIQRIFNELIYKPLLEILQEPDEFKNATGSALLEAIRSGRVWYADGQFQGDFNALISKQLKKIGANFSGRTRTWFLAQASVPADIKFAQAHVDARAQEMQRRLIAALDGMNVADVDSITKTQENYEKTLDHMEADFKKTIPPGTPVSDSPATARSRITVEAVLTEAQKTAIAKDWGTNLNLYIKGWAQDNILKLRDQIQPHVLAGGRAQGLVKAIQENHGVSQRKAKFLARQETALLMSKFQETRYADMGISKYQWSDSHDKRVRHDHHELNGKIFSFSSPPITNKKTGARNNPGQDYNCRCIAIPVVE